MLRCSRAIQVYINNAKHTLTSIFLLKVHLYTRKKTHMHPTTSQAQRSSSAQNDRDLALCYIPRRVVRADNGHGSAHSDNGEEERGREAELEGKLGEEVELQRQRDGNTNTYTR